jgi:predicted Zn-dependent peptidase
MGGLLVATLSVLVGASAAFAQKTNIEFTEYELPNGLKVILHEDHSTPIVAVTMMYHVGSKNENPARTGFAHFFEHLLFEGSENIKRGEFDKYVANAGGTLNANTWYDRTFYHEVLPSNQLAMGLWLESERMLHAKVELKGIETQRQVVKEERRLRIDNQPYGRLLEETMARCYKVHPYQWSVIGSMAHLDAAVEADYVNFYKTFYVPNNAILSIAGDINPADAKKLIADYFASIPKGKGAIPRPTTPEPPLTTELRDSTYDNIQLPALVMAYRVPPQGGTDYYAISMLAQLLSEGESSRLRKALVNEQQNAIEAASFTMNLEDPSVVLLFAIANSGYTTRDLEKSIDAEIAKVQNEPMPEQEFQKLRNQIENNLVSGYTSMIDRAEALANYKMYFGDANLINAEIDKYMAVTRQDIQAAAKKYLVKNNRVVLDYLPKKP